QQQRFCIELSALFSTCNAKCLHAVNKCIRGFEHESLADRLCGSCIPQRRSFSSLLLQSTSVIQSSLTCLQGYDDSAECHCCGENCAYCGPRFPPDMACSTRPPTLSESREDF